VAWSTIELQCLREVGRWQLKLELLDDKLLFGSKFGVSAEDEESLPSVVGKRTSSISPTTSLSSTARDVSSNANGFARKNKMRRNPPASLPRKKPRGLHNRRF